MSKATAFKDFTDDDLKQELARREVERKEQERREMSKRQKIAFGIIQSLLSLCPKHNCTTCSDDNLRNSDIYPVACSRCDLLSALRQGCFDDDLDVQVVLTRREV